MTCDLPMPGEECFNVICRWNYRHFRWNYSVAMRSGYLRVAINHYKYENVKSWGYIFARVLVGFLDSLPDTFRPFDLIVASPTYLANDGVSRDWDHTRFVLQHANDISEGAWPFDMQDPPAIIKTAPTERFQGKNWKQRWEIAKTTLRAALRIPSRTRIAGKRILVYDDVFTDGITLNEVARCLRNAGAADVCGVTLCRQPLRERA